MNKWVQKWLKIYLKCFISLVLYHRNVYPSSTFDLTTFQGFNLPQFIPINRSKVLKDYVEELILDILDKLPHIYLISLCIIDCKDDLCIERYCLDFGEFRHISGSEDTNDLHETEVFDEFRSSLNSLILHIERLPAIRDETVTFEVMINTVDLGLGHGVIDVATHQDADEVLLFERDTNWVRVREDDMLVKHSRDDATDERSSSDTAKPKVKMVSLASCVLEPLVIHSYFELLLTLDEVTSSVYVPATNSSSEPNV